MSPSVTVRLLGTQSDARLVELARQGHERAFEALVQRYRRPLLSYCRRALLPDARAEDALQQALLQAWLALQRGDEVRDARAWLYRIVRNTALNALRGSGYDYAELSEALSGVSAPQEDLDRRIAVREALAGLATLPAQQREALMRTALEGASHADAAAQMGVSEPALRGLVSRARATLRTAMTALTPMPLATWAAGHGGGAVAELAVSGGSAGLAGLLVKGGAVAVTAGVLAAGVGSVEHARHDAASHRHARSVVRQADERSATRLAAAAPIAVAPVPAAVPGSATTPSRRRRHGHRHSAADTDPIAATPIGSHKTAPPVQPLHPRRGDDDGPRHGPSEGGDGARDADGGQGPGTRGDGQRSSGSGSGGSGSGGGSGDDRQIGGTTGSGDDSGSSGSSDGGERSGSDGQSGTDGGGSGGEGSGSSEGGDGSSGADDGGS